MADDVTLDNGALTDFVVSADEVPTGKYIQRMKLCYSADGDATHIAADANGLKVNGSGVTQPVSGTFWQATQPVSGTVALGAGAAAVGIVDVNSDVLHDATNTTEAVQTGGHASPQQTAPTAVSAAGDRVRAWHDLNGAAIVRPRKLPTYRAVYRLATRPYPLSKALTANTRSQYATIHHAASATKTVRIRRAQIAVVSSSAGANLHVDFVRITAAPATGNPAITSILADGADSAAEVTCLALPTTAGTEAASVYGTAMFGLGITAALPTTNPPPTMPFVDLFEPGNYDGDSKPLIIRAGILEGFAISVDTDSASTITALCAIEFTEE